MLHKPIRSEKPVLWYQSPRRRQERKARLRICIFQRSLRASDHRIDEGFDLGPLILQSFLYCCWKSLSNGVFAESMLGYRLGDLVWELSDVY